jgi:alpha-glucosidase
VYGVEWTLTSRREASDKAGFTRGEPWLPLAPEHRHLYVENQRSDATTLLALHRRLLQVRRAHPALAIGGYRPIAASGDLLLYQRVLGS